MNAPLSVEIDDFDYPLKEESIAKFPLANRDEARLLCLTKSGEAEDKFFYELPELLSQDDILILNNTKVVYARLFFKKESGSTIEIFCLEPVEPCEMQLAFSEKHSSKWKCLVGNNRKWKGGRLTKTADFEGESITLAAERLEQSEDAWIVRFEWDKGRSFAEILQKMGVVPLPPYLKREAEENDKADYQTIYADFDGSVAAPTAGLHFSDRTFRDLEARNIDYDFVTLHVGAGTFKPVSSKTIGEHVMHTERVSIARKTIARLVNNPSKRVICVGTTSVRTMESLYWHGVKLIESGGGLKEIDIKQWEPYRLRQDVAREQALEAILRQMDSDKADTLTGQTQLMIAPPYHYKLVSGMVTNFHQPKSTLLLLVSAMIGDDWRKAYKHAAEQGYRFLSFGDACLFFCKDKF